MHQDLIFHAPGGIGGKPCPFGGIEGGDAFDQADGADGDQILLVRGLGIVFFHNVGDQAQVALDENIAGIQIPLLGQFQVVLLLLGGEGLGEAAGGKLQGIQQGAEYQPYGSDHASSPQGQDIQPCLSTFPKK